ncbi:hypothetical protein KC19_VG023200 [Ceratodon purpureus]|uniref:RING-type E3 ubiquitin transferase n=1 Tax=Ceratodon purpureus TaxID=3225 RepID=A0A8T0HL77_CERPU|nr:hypothetical protein KC19_VG023200 [Ceratodon purpureus]
MSKEIVYATSTQSTKLCEIFECNICFNEAIEAVVTCCGHLFCWPCLYMWLYVHSLQQSCPVCIGIIEEGDITPIYGPTNLEKPSWIDGILRNKDGERLIPPRPQARRLRCGRQLNEQRIDSRSEQENGNNAHPSFEAQIQRHNDYDQMALELASNIPLPDQTNLEEIVVTSESREQILNDPNMSDARIQNDIIQNENNGGNIIARLDQ